MQGSEAPHYFTPRIGEYDMWAIKYGYMAVEGEAEEALAEHEVSLPRREGDGGRAFLSTNGRGL
ncbi:unnamed protein product [Hapterophycus canaliculatus]